MTEEEVESFTYDGGVITPGERVQFRYTISETYLGDPIRIPVTVINGCEAGPTIFLAAASRGDELNGIEVVREVAHEYSPARLHGTVICLPVLNVPAFRTQQRHIPVFNRDLNRAFPGDPSGTGAKRIANEIYRNFIEPCDLGLDFHTSTRGRTNMFRVRANMTNNEVARLAHAFGSKLVISTRGTPGMLRRAATDDGISTVTVAMGEAHRFERDLIDRALDGVRSVFAEYRLHPQEKVHWPGWRTVVEYAEEKRWLRANSGGIVEMFHEPGDMVDEADTLCTISNPFVTDVVPVTAPFTGLLIGVLENPVVYPGNPLCHLVELDDATHQILDRQQ